MLDSKRILLPANREVEIDRIIRFAADLKQPTIIYGAREAYRPDAIALLKKAGLPVLVSMKWPTPTAGPDAHLEEESMRQLETYELAAHRSGAVTEGRREVRALLGWHRYAARLSAGGEEGHGCRPYARAGVARSDA